MKRTADQIAGNVIASLIIAFGAFALARWVGLDWAVGYLAYFTVVNLGGVMENVRG